MTRNFFSLQTMTIIESTNSSLTGAFLTELLVTTQGKNLSAREFGILGNLGCLCQSQIPPLILPTTKSDFTRKRRNKV
jgi:hypothetical protein